MGRPKQPTLTVDRRHPQTDQGAALIRVGKMPPADALSPSGMTCWNWASICRAFQADPATLASLLPERHVETQHKAIGGFTLQNE